MSLGVAIKGPEGIVLAADSRVTIGAVMPGQPSQIPIHYDNATKVLSLSGRHRWVGAVTYGTALVGNRTVHSFLPEFEVSLGADDRLARVEEYAQKLSDFFSERWKESMPVSYQGPPLTVLVGGYDRDEPYGSVFVVEIPTRPVPQARNPGKGDFGITWGGQLEFASRLIHGYDPAIPALMVKHLGLGEEKVTAFLAEIKAQLEFKLPYGILPLQDCVDLATFLIRTTITAQSLAVGIRGVGGHIDVAVVTRTEGLRFVQRRQLHGEATLFSRKEDRHSRG